MHINASEFTINNGTRFGIFNISLRILHKETFVVSLVNNAEDKFGFPFTIKFLNDFLEYSKFVRDRLKYGNWDFTYCVIGICM